MPHSVNGPGRSVCCFSSFLSKSVPAIVAFQVLPFCKCNSLQSFFPLHPSQVSVRRTSFFGFSSTHRCGGAIINSQWIATAGHCVDESVLFPYFLILCAAFQCVLSFPIFRLIRYQQLFMMMMSFISERKGYRPDDACFQLLQIEREYLMNRVLRNERTFAEICSQINFIGKANKRCTDFR